MMYLVMYLMMYLMMYHDSIEVFLKKKIMNSNFSAHEAIKLAPWRPGVPTSTASQLSIAWRQFSWLWRQAAFVGSTDVAQKQTDISEDVSRSCARLTLYDQPSHQNMAISIQSYVNHMIRGDISLLSPPSLNFYTKHVRDHSVAIGFIPWVQVAESQQPEDFSQSQQETLTMVMESR